MADRRKEGTTDVTGVTDEHRWIWGSPQSFVAYEASPNLPNNRCEEFDLT